MRISDWSSDVCSSDLNDRGEPDSTVWHHHLMCSGSISVQHRLTGYGYGTWDEETAYMSPCGKFWLATCGVDIRDCLDEFDSEEGMKIGRASCRERVWQYV